MHSIHGILLIGKVILDILRKYAIIKSDNMQATARENTVLFAQRPAPERKSDGRLAAVLFSVRLPHYAKNVIKSGGL